MKKNVKGFMLAETLVVASFISITLLFLFAQFRTIVKNFNTSSRYNTVNALYLTNQIKDYLKENNFQGITIDLENSSEGYVEISACTSKYFTDVSYCQELMSQADVNKVIYTSSQNPSISSDFSKDFVEFINRSINTEENIYYLFTEFKDGTYGALKMNGLYFPTFTEKVTSEDIYTFDTGTVDGVYVDNYSEDVRYVFRGSNPNNYISFNNQLWRIIAIESQGVKIIGPSIISFNWNSDTNYFTRSSSLSLGSYTDVSIKNSSSFDILNYDYDLDGTTGLDGGYYTQLSSSSRNFVLENATWYNGDIAYNTASSLQTIVDYENERSYLGALENGHLSLMNVSDYIKSSLDTTCVATPFSGTNCENKNWLATMGESMWTLNASTEENEVYFISSTIFSQNVTMPSEILPVLYLKPNLRLTGSGTEIDPYIIVEEK